MRRNGATKPAGVSVSSFRAVRYSPTWASVSLIGALRVAGSAEPSERNLANAIRS